MAELLGQATDRFGLFWLVAARVSGLFFVMPVFAHRAVPVMVRVGITLIFALALVPVVALPPGGVPQDLLGYAATFTRELGIGLAMGFLVLLVFAVAEVAGQLLDVEMGYSIVNILDPVLGQPMPVVGNLLHFLAIILFLLVNGHHLLFSAMAESFQRVPPGAAILGPAGYQMGLDEVAWMFLAAVKIASPLLGILFLVSVVLALLTRSAPQLNIFTIGIPAKMALGLLGLGITAPVYVLALRGLFPHAYQTLARFVGVMVP